MELFSHLVVETAGACNRTCTSCLRQSYPRGGATLPLLRTVQHQVGASELMPEPLFERIVDEAAELAFRGLVTLQFFNEPLLDVRLGRLGRYVKEQLPGSPLWICSNADLLTEARAAELDGVFDQINVALYLPRHRQPQREQLLRSWFRTTRLKFTHGEHVVTHHSPGAALDRLVERVIERPCTQFNGMLIINWDGTVSHCCDDVAGDFALGNVHDLSISDVWFGARNLEIVAALSRPGGRREFAYCRSCPRRGHGDALGDAAKIRVVKQAACQK